MSRPWDDDELLARLAEARQAADRVPREFIEAGKAAYAWRDIDAQLAELLYDSALEEAQLARQMRAAQAQLRALTSTPAALTVAIPVSHEPLPAQLGPPARR